jgi:hypothetical protein
LTPVKFASLLFIKNLTLNHLPELQGRQGEQDLDDCFLAFRKKASNSTPLSAESKPGNYSNISWRKSVSLMRM